MEQQPENVIFWGAGATAALGIRMTEGQTKFIRCITGVHSNDKLRKRIKEALGPNIGRRWCDALFDLITILGDTDRNYDSIDFINKSQLKAMDRNWPKAASSDHLESRIIALRLIYDWPALKSLVSICPGSSKGTFKLNDLFNLLDMHIPLGFGVRAPKSNNPGSATKAETQFFDAGDSSARRTRFV